MYDYKFIQAQGLKQKKSYFDKQCKELINQYKDIIDIKINWLNYYDTISFIVNWNKQVNMLSNRFNINNAILTMLNNQYCHNLNINHIYIE